MAGGLPHALGLGENLAKECREEAGIGPEDLDAVGFYDKPLLKFEWLLETNLSYAPKGFRSFLLAMPVWLKEELCLKAVLKKRWPNSAPSAFPTCRS